MNAPKNSAPWAKLIELAILFSLIGLVYTLYAQGYLDRILGNPLSLWFFWLILVIVLVVEAFGLALEKLVPATKIWRRMYESEKQLAGDALNFMKAEVAKRW